MLIAVSSPESANAPTKEKDKEIYENIEYLLDQEIITCKEAQVMWLKYKKNGKA